MGGERERSDEVLDTEDIQEKSATRPGGSQKPILLPPSILLPFRGSEEKTFFLLPTFAYVCLVRQSTVTLNREAA